MSTTGAHTRPFEVEEAAGDRKPTIFAAVGVIGALLASSCCILPLALFSVGIGGAWIGNLTAFAPYQPIFVAATFAILGYGYYLVYWKPKVACNDGMACARQMPKRFVKFLLWAATVLIIAASAFPFVAPYLLALY